MAPSFPFEVTKPALHISVSHTALYIFKGKTCDIKSFFVELEEMAIAHFKVRFLSNSKLLTER